MWLSDCPATFHAEIEFGEGNLAGVSRLRTLCSNFVCPHQYAVRQTRRKPSLFPGSLRSVLVRRLSDNLTSQALGHMLCYFQKFSIFSQNAYAIPATRITATHTSLFASSNPWFPATNIAARYIPTESREMVAVRR